MSGGKHRGATAPLDAEPLWPAVGPVLALALLVAVMFEALPGPWQTAGEWALAAAVLVWIGHTAAALRRAVRSRAAGLTEHGAWRWWWHLCCAASATRELMDAGRGTGLRVAAVGALVAVLLSALTDLVVHRRGRSAEPSDTAVPGAPAARTAADA